VCCVVFVVSVCWAVLWVFEGKDKRLMQCALVTAVVSFFFFNGDWNKVNKPTYGHGFRRNGAISTFYN
jgi:hypothetical protein